MYPFNEERVRYGGASSFEEFRNWVLKYGEEFLYTQANTKKGDILVFAWIREKGDWVLVGDAIVKDNHKCGEVDWCDCEDNEYYHRHLITGGLRIYPTSIESKRLNLKLGSFASIDADEYLNLLAATVSHW